MEPLQKIKTFWLVVDYVCNNRCLGCYASESLFIHNPIDFNYALRIVQIMSDLEAIDCLLIGGEPTLYKDLPRLIEKGTALGISFKLVTNGRRLADKHYLLNLKNAGLVHASISIEGTEATHNQIAQTKSYHQSINAVENCISQGLSFNTLLTINQNNYRDIMQLASDLNNIGVKNILFNIGLPSCGSQNDDGYCLPPTKTAIVIRNAYKAFKENSIKAKFLATIPLCLFSELELEEMVQDDYISDGAHCHIFYGSGVVFEPNGNVLPCTHFVAKPLFNMFQDNINSADDFKAIWFGKKGIHGDFKKAVWHFPHINCMQCKQWGKCVGGCPFLWLKYNPNEIITNFHRKEAKNGSFISDGLA